MEVLGAFKVLALFWGNTFLSLGLSPKICLFGKWSQHILGPTSFFKWVRDLSD
jgi:hypothetical protein